LYNYTTNQLPNNYLVLHLHINTLVSSDSSPYRPPKFSGRLIREGAYTVALLLFSTMINTALSPLLFYLPPASFPNFLLLAPCSSLSLIHAPLDPSHLASLDFISRSASPQQRILNPCLVTKPLSHRAITAAAMLLPARLYERRQRGFW
jgi:hypothetical protein